MFEERPEDQDSRLADLQVEFVRKYGTPTFHDLQLLGGLMMFKIGYIMVNND